MSDSSLIECDNDSVVLCQLCHHFIKGEVIDFPVLNYQLISVCSACYRLLVDIGRQILQISNENGSVRLEEATKELQIYGIDSDLVEMAFNGLTICKILTK